MVFSREKTPVLPPDYALVEIEPNAEPIAGSDTKKLEAPVGGGSASLTYSKDVSIDLTDKKVLLMFANPGKSTQDMVIQLVIKDTVVVLSGRILPGHRVTVPDLAAGAEKSLSAGDYDGKFISLSITGKAGKKSC